MENQNTQPLPTEESLNTDDLSILPENDVAAEILALEADNTTNTNDIEINQDLIDPETTEPTAQLPGKQLADVCFVNGKWVAC
ncbi:hypothetical protein [Nostoc sp. PCC 7107]|uniref:hypothetical protein n=1 Tax=Nostoc sp. PCC 7107 TaxID=317936 RepID=UPI00029EC99F|nr:hypothetical protein [Nostoc sp. PCC 7107]AFY43517.1 hypothetical protein Nos7107_2921 [Nostoc sp. PCC 7107]